MAGGGVQFREMLGILRGSLAEVPEHRQGSNRQYEIADAGLAAFSVFFMQSPSFLARQRDMQRRRGKNNAESVFRVERIPSDGQIRNMLDLVEPRRLGQSFWEINGLLQANGQLKRYRGIKDTLLVSMDGSQHFSSEKINCPNCHHRRMGTRSKTASKKRLSAG